MGCLCVFRILFRNNVQNQVQIRFVKMRRCGILFPNRRKLLWVFTDILCFRQYQIIIANELFHCRSCQTIPLDSLLINKLFQNVTIGVWRMSVVGETQIPPVMKQTIVISLHIFPCPILNSQLAKAFPLLRNILSGIIP